MTTLYLDVTHTFVTGLATGIQRVVRKVTAELLHAPVAGVDRVRPVVAVDGAFLLLDDARVERLLYPGGAAGRAAPPGRATRLVARLGAHLPVVMDGLQQRRFARAAEAAIGGSLDRAEPGAGDLVLMLDAFWGGSTTLAAAREARRRGAAVVGVAYDLIPVTHPQYMTPVAATLFARRLREALALCDGFVAISRATADELARFAGTTPVRTEVAYCGSDFALPAAIAPDEDASPGAPFRYVVVGTLEPRKGHAIVLDAFERLWAGGSAARLTFVGRRGWGIDALWERCRLLTAHGAPFRLVDDADDATLARILADSSAAIVASEVEGFGLPVVEALACDLPVIASDIPVFREITNRAASFFAPSDPAALASAVLAFERDPAPMREAARGFRWPTWREAARGYAEATLRISTQAGGAA